MSHPAARPRRPAGCPGAPSKPAPRSPPRLARHGPVAPGRGQHDDAAACRFRRRSHQGRAAGGRHLAQLPCRRLRHVVEDLCAQQAERLPQPAHRAAASRSSRSSRRRRTCSSKAFDPACSRQWVSAPTSCSDLNPRLVVTRVSGWGQTGPYRNKPGFGTLVEGYSGFASMNGFADREPVLPPMFLGDMTTGLYGASATMMALWRLASTGGAGQVIDLSLFEPTLSILGPQAANFRFTGEMKPRTGSRSSTTAPRNVYLTADGNGYAFRRPRKRWRTECSRLSAATTYRRSAKCDGSRPATPRRGDRPHRRRLHPRKTLAENLAFFNQAEVTIGPICDAAQLKDDATSSSANAWSSSRTWISAPCRCTTSRRA